MKKHYSLFCVSLFLFLASNAQGTWVQKLTLPSNIRIEAGAFSVGTKGYIVAGRQGTNYFNDTWEYDPSGDTWTQRNTFTGGGRREPVCFSIGSKGYVGTGWNATQKFSDLWEFDPIGNSWAQKANYPGGVRRDAAGFSIGSKGYLGTGQDAATGINKNDFYEYDPALDKWTIKAAFPGAIRNAGIGLSIGTKGYMGLGRAGTTEYSDFYEYDPTLDKWTAKANFAPGTREEIVSFTVGSLGYVGTGFTSSGTAGNKNDFWAYDPTLDSWSQVTSLTGLARTEGVAFNCNGKGYVSCGYGGTSAQNDLWEFTPSGLGVTENISNITQADIYPSPATQHFMLDVTSVQNEKIVVEIFSVNGKRIEKTEHSVIAGKNQININSEMWEQGIYFLEIHSGNSVTAKKVVITK